MQPGLEGKPPTSGGERRTPRRRRAAFAIGLWSLVLACSGLAMASSPAAAQVPRGATVRAHLDVSPPVIGIVDRIAPDTLWIEEGLERRGIPLRSIVRLELARRRTRQESGWRWARRGFLVGALAGAVHCLSDRESCRVGIGQGGSVTAGVLQAAVVWGAGGGAVGFAGGAAFPGRAWYEASVGRPSGPAPVPQPVEGVRAATPSTSW